LVLSALIAGNILGNRDNKYNNDFCKVVITKNNLEINASFNKEENKRNLFIGNRSNKEFIYASSNGKRENLKFSKKAPPYPWFFETSWHERTGIHSGFLASNRTDLEKIYNNVYKTGLDCDEYYKQQ